jgi:hypothetical protein
MILHTAGDLEHILESRRHLALRSDKERFQCIMRDCWVNHPQVSSIRSVVRTVHEMPPISRSQCIAITGITGSGKTSLFERIENDLSTLRKRQNSSRGYLSFTLSPDPNLRGFGDSLGEALGMPFGKIRTGLIPQSFSRMANLRRIRIIMIDDFHNILNANKTEQRKVLTFFRAMTGPPLCLSIVAFGTIDVASALLGDDQLSERFEMYEFSDWREDEAFRSFLAAYESNLPLKEPSELWQQEKVKYLLSATSGVTGRVVKRIKRAAIWAIMDGKEHIDLESLKKAVSIPPFADTVHYED